VFDNFAGVVLALKKDSHLKFELPADQIMKGAEHEATIEDELARFVVLSLQSATLPVNWPSGIVVDRTYFQ
jgi:hypothetical protein